MRGRLQSGRSTQYELTCGTWSARAKSEADRAAGGRAVAWGSSLQDPLPVTSERRCTADKDSAIFMYIIGVGAPGATHLECRTLMLVLRSFWHSQPRHVAPPSDGLPP